jgi:hypothetical protein
MGGLADQRLFARSPLPSTAGCCGMGFLRREHHAIVRSRRLLLPIQQGLSCRFECTRRQVEDQRQ